MGDDRDSQDPGFPARKTSSMRPLRLPKLDWRWLSVIVMIAGGIYGLGKRAERIEHELAEAAALRDAVPAVVVRLNLLESRAASLEAAVAELRRICGGPP